MAFARKRPLGITLIAIQIFAIGCFGSLFFPLIVLTGHTDEIGTVLLGRWINSEALRAACIYIVLGIWYAFYVLYVFLGVGLWRLKAWARRALLYILTISLGVFVIPILFIPVPAAFKFAMVFSLTLGTAWFVWYLQRANVRFAFSATMSLKELTPIPGPPPKPSANRNFKIAAAAIASFGAFFALVMFASESMMTSSGAYQLALSRAAESPCVRSHIGLPLKPGWNTSGNMEESTSTGKAELNIPISGPNGKGELYFEAKKRDGIWTLSVLSLIQGADEDHLIPTSEANCH